MIPDFETATLAEKQMYFYNGAFCIYCKQPTEIVDSIVVYYQSHGFIYYCKDCQAWVGQHKGKDAAFGTVAKKPLRDLRHEAHKWFDGLWKAKMERENCKIRKARAKAYGWLAELLNIDKVQSHIGYFTERECEIVIEECKKFYKI